ncbi:MAG: hypothetical protein WAX12_13625 [Candidatus Microthrix subdominans]
MLTNTQTKPTQALAVPEPAPPQRALSPAESWQGLMLDQKLHYATILADSTIIPDDYRKRPANILIACSKGAALGLSPEDSLYAIHVIKGRPSLSAEAMRARVQAMGHKLTIESSVTSATVTLERTDGHPGGSKTYTTEMAHRAGLDKPSKTGVPSKWTLDPEPMCIARASSRVLKAHAADLVSGITFAEDVIDEPMIEIGGGSPVEALQATTEAVAAIEAPEPVKKVSKPAEPPQAADEPEDAEIVPDEPTQATLDSADDNSDSLSADEWRALLKERGLNLGDIADAAKELGFESGVSYAKLGMLEPESCGRLLEALPAGNGAPFA